MRATAYDVLPVGTNVRVGNRVGIVTKSEMVPAHPCGVVASNHISFTGSIKTVFGKVKRVETYDKPTAPKPISYVAIEIVGADTTGDKTS